MYTFCLLFALLPLWGLYLLPPTGRIVVTLLFSHQISPYTLFIVKSILYTFCCSIWRILCVSVRRLVGRFGVSIGRFDSVDLFDVGVFSFASTSAVILSWEQKYEHFDIYSLFFLWITAYYTVRRSLFYIFFFYHLANQNQKKRSCVFLSIVSSSFSSDHGYFSYIFLSQGQKRRMGEHIYYKICLILSHITLLVL